MATRQRPQRLEEKRQLIATFIIRLDLDVLFPDLGTRAQGDDEVTGARGLWLPAQAHAGHVVQAVAFAVVALGAGASGIGPSILAAQATWDNMVDREISLAQDSALDLPAKPDAAIDAGVVVPHQDAFAAPMGFAARHINVRLQGDDGGNFEFPAHGIQVLARHLHRDGFAGK